MVNMNHNECINEKILVAMKYLFLHFFYSKSHFQRITKKGDRLIVPSELNMKYIEMRLKENMLHC